MANERILIVDDDTGTIRIHQYWLEKLGLEVIKATNEEEAYEQLQLKPDLVATDLHLVEGDHNQKQGYGIARRALAQGAKVVIQSVTADPSERIVGVDIIPKETLVIWVKEQLGL